MTVRGVIIFDNYGQHYPAFASTMQQWLSDGKIKFHEHRVEGLENAHQAFIDPLEERNVSKMRVQISAESQQKVQEAL